MRKSVVVVGLLAWMLAVSVPSFACEIQKDKVKTVPSNYAKLEKDKIVFGKSATAYAPDQFDRVLQAYGVALSADAVKANKVPKAYAKLEKDKVVFGRDSAAYSPETANQILEAYGMKLPAEAVKANKVPKTYAKLDKDKIVFGKDSTAYAPETWDEILRAYECPKGVEPPKPGCPDADGDGVCDDTDQCPDTPKGVKVDARGCPLDSDGDGVPDYLDKCPDTPKGVKVDKDGCPLTEVKEKPVPGDEDGDGVTDDKDKCPGTPKGAKVNEVGCWIVEGLLFDYKKWDIKPIYYKNLDEVVKVVNSNPSMKVVIEGHTCDIGGPAYNMGLSQRRAESVRQYFIKKGISADRLSTKGYGLTCPVAPNTSEENRAKNRRVELTPVYKGKEYPSFKEKCTPVTPEKAAKPEKVKKPVKKAAPKKAAPKKK